ncbi:MAG: hypothetical protein K6A34_06210 [Methanobrevibacter sp.]|nr:hypothetical protein [Methanobrevibacter sp.]
MSVESTNKLLRKYENNYVQGERRTTIQEKIHKQKQLKREKHELTDELLNETKVLLLTNTDKEHVHYLVNKFDDFNSLHRTASKEAIILAFIFYVAKTKTPKRQLKEYSFTSKYGLTEPVFELIMCRIVQRLLEEAPIVPKNTKKYDNDILYKTGLR